MATDPKKIESLLNKLATDDDFRQHAENNPASAYAEHGLEYNEPAGGGHKLPTKDQAAEVVNELSDTSQKVFADKVYADKVYADKVFADKVFAQKVFKHSAE